MHPHCSACWNCYGGRGWWRSRRRRPQSLLSDAKAKFVSTWDKSERSHLQHRPAIRLSSESSWQNALAAGVVDLSLLSAADVTRFVQRRASTIHSRRVQLMTTALRSFLRYARYRGDIEKDL